MNMKKVVSQKLVPLCPFIMYVFVKFHMCVFYNLIAQCVLCYLTGLSYSNDKGADLKSNPVIDGYNKLWH